MPEERRIYIFVNAGRLDILHGVHFKQETTCSKTLMSTPKSTQYGIELLECVQLHHNYIQWVVPCNAHRIRNYEATGGK